MKIFADNFLAIAKHNTLYAAGEESYEMGINQFSDMVSIIKRDYFTIDLHYFYNSLQ